jgi:hypothetical protein
MAITERQAPMRSIPRAQAVQAERRTLPVRVWAAVGGMILALEVYVLTRWITGPYFTHVHSGPSVPPTWMRVALIGVQATLIPATVALFYWFVIRPWRRDRRLGVDGLLVIAFLTMCWQDPLCNYNGAWFTYNSWLVNMGSWVNDVPGWTSFGQPGHQLAAPILYVVGVYVPAFVVVMLLGSWVMRMAKRRWPRMSTLELVGVCFVTMAVYDFVLEGVLFMPLGVFTYAGGHVALFPSTYHKYPLNETLTTAALFTAVACLRYFINDRGQSLAERGIEHVEGSSSKRLTLRILATIGAVQLTMLVCYVIPNFWTGSHSTAWPAAIQKRSYFTDYLCGDGTDRACPGPSIPISRNNNFHPAASSAYATPTGHIGWPSAARRPVPVSFEPANP